MQQQRVKCLKINLKTPILICRVVQGPEKMHNENTTTREKVTAPVPPPATVPSNTETEAGAEGERVPFALKVARALGRDISDIPSPPKRKRRRRRRKKDD